MTIQANFSRVQERIQKAAIEAGRNPEKVRLVVVTKGHPVEAVAEAIAAGARLIGENYAEEGVAKQNALSPGKPVEWHMIGHVQSRKAALVCGHFAWVQSVDSLKLARRLANFAYEQGRTLQILLECNVSGEASKFGWQAWKEPAWESLLPDLEALLALPGLEVRGLMTMAPYLENPEQARLFFQRLRQLRDFLQKHLPGANWSELSMGMSADFEVAIQEGATLVRIGTAIMGPRPQKIE